MSSTGWLGSLITGLFGTAQQGAQMAYDASQANKNREFQSEEAELNRVFQSNEAALQRDWSSQEAERAMDWEEEMYAKYNSLSGKIAQAEQAGVNPMFAVTGNAVTPMSASPSTPSGASAGSVGTPSGDSASMAFVDIIGKVLGFKQVQSQINVDNALADKYRKEAEGQSITNETLREWNVTQILEARSRIEYNNENTALVTSKILNTDADTEKKSAELGQIASSIKNMEADTDVKVRQLAVMTSEIIKNERSLDVMSAQIASMASEVGLNRERGKEIAQSVRNMVQEYGYRDAINGFETIIASYNASMASEKDPSNYTGVGRVVRTFVNELKEVLSLGASGVVSSK